MIKNKIINFILLLFLNSVIHAHNNDSGHILGKITFPTSANSTAQPLFIKGVLLLHSFEYDNARRYFLQAEKADPNFALAYWGEAMTYNHALWGEQNTTAAQNALEKFAPNAIEREQKTQTPKEKGFMHAVNLLFGTGSKTKRDCDYTQAMHDLYQQFPNDDEIAAFYALALLGSTEGERDEKIYMEAAGIAEDIFDHNKQHPGASHYAIHSYDDPTHAPLGLRAARLYAKIAPGASHALHMPSHIFLALGLWDDVIASNKAAWEAGVKQNPTLDPQKIMVHDLHALQWLMYGYLQKADYKQAFFTVKQMEKIALKNTTPMVRWYYSLTRAEYILQTQDWHAKLVAVNTNDIEMSAHAADVYVNAMISLQTKDQTAIIKAISALEKLCHSIPRDVPNTQSHEDYFTSITSNGIAIGKIAVLELKAQVKQIQGDTKEAFKFMQKAVALEEKMSFGYGPPLPIKPAHELYADLLLSNKQYLTAYQAYLAAIKRTPNRLDAKNGLQTASLELKRTNTPIHEKLSIYFHKLMLGNKMHAV